MRVAACICILASSHGWLVGEALHVTDRAVDAGSRSKARVALILRGEAFRGGRSGQQYIATKDYTSIQSENYRSHLERVVLPFESAGHEVDVFTAMYQTPHDHLFKKAFGRRLKVFEYLPFNHSNQATNAVLNLEAFHSYVGRTGNEYRFVVFARHDARFMRDLSAAILGHRAPDDTVFLYGKVPITQVLPRSPEERCRKKQWNVLDRSSVAWYCSDRLQVVPQKFLPAFSRILNGSLLLDARNRQHGPRWPGECWAELQPLVGGDEHIDFLDEGLMKMCKVCLEHSTPRVGQVENSARDSLENNFNQCWVHHIGLEDKTCEVAAR